MLTALAKFVDAVAFDFQVHLFVLFALLVWGVWGYKMWLARSYRPITGTFDGTYSILIPTFQEFPERLYQAINTALQQSALEVIVICDEREPEVQGQVKREFADLVRIMVSPPGKRAAVALGVGQARGDIIMVTASDVRMHANAVANLLAPFSDPQVGGACGYTRAIIEKDNLASLVFFWITEMRAKLTYRALGSRYQVQVLDGECFGVRREYWQGVLDRFLNQRFLGARPVSGDDGWITTLLLEDGWRTVYQENARVNHYTPTSFGDLIKQQMRWSRNSVRRSWYVLSRGIAFRTGAPYCVHTIASLVKAPLFAVILGVAVGRSLGLWDLGGQGVSWTQGGSAQSSETALVFGGVATYIIVFVGLTLTRAIRGIPRYEKGRITFDLFLMPAYAIIGLFILMPLRIYATITARRVSWGTRKNCLEATGSQALSLVGTVAAVSMALLIPIGFLVTIGLGVSPLVPVSVAAAAPTMGDWDY